LAVWGSGPDASSSVFIAYDGLVNESGAMILRSSLRLVDRPPTHGRREHAVVDGLQVDIAAAATASGA
jgi:hypothetical protein